MSRKRPSVTIAPLNADQVLPSLLSSFTGAAVAHTPITELTVDQIRPRRNQPRRQFNPATLGRLTESVRAHGILQPLTVHLAADGYELIAGERRLRAARAAGLRTVPVRVLPALSEADVQQLSAIENLQREDLSPVDEADAVLDILEVQLGISRLQLTPRLERWKSLKMRDPELLRANDEDRAAIGQLETIFSGLSRGLWTSFVSNRLPVLRLPADLIDAVRGGTLEYTKAVALRSVPAAERPAWLQVAQQHSLAELRVQLRQAQPTPQATATPAQLISHTAAQLADLDWQTLSAGDQRRIGKLLSELSVLLTRAGER